MPLFRQRPFFRRIYDAVFAAIRFTRSIFRFAARRYFSTGSAAFDVIRLFQLFLRRHYAIYFIFRFHTFAVALLFYPDAAEFLRHRHSGESDGMLYITPDAGRQAEATPSQRRRRLLFIVIASALLHYRLIFFFFTVPPSSMMSHEFSFAFTLSCRS